MTSHTPGVSWRFPRPHPLFFLPVALGPPGGALLDFPKTGVWFCDTGAPSGGPGAILENVPRPARCVVRTLGGHLGGQAGSAVRFSL